jgi:hypothetical protein
MENKRGGNCFFAFLVTEIGPRNVSAFLAKASASFSSKIQSSSGGGTFSFTLPA